MGEIQVRKDLASISAGGKPKVGYLVGDLIDRLEESLGYRVRKAAVLFGAGKLGQALLGYSGFRDYGFEIVAAFDTDERLVGKKRQGKPVLSLKEFPNYCREAKIKIGIITVPQDQAQSVCDLMVQNGIRAIWNFSPTYLNAPQDVLVRYENMALSLAYLSGRLTEETERLCKE